jgi:hypothetical protein
MTPYLLSFFRAASRQENVCERCGRCAAGAEFRVRKTGEDSSAREL